MNEWPPYQHHQFTVIEMKWKKNQIETNLYLSPFLPLFSSFLSRFAHFTVTKSTMKKSEAMASKVIQLFSLVTLWFDKKKTTIIQLRPQKELSHSVLKCTMHVAKMIKSLLIYILCQRYWQLAEIDKLVQCARALYNLLCIELTSNRSYNICFFNRRLNPIDSYIAFRRAWKESQQKRMHLIIRKPLHLSHSVHQRGREEEEK